MCGFVIEFGEGAKADAAFKRQFPDLFPLLPGHADSGLSWQKCKPSLTGYTMDFSRLVTAVFHMGFLSVVETDEHLGRLDGPSPRTKQAKVARSKIGKTNRNIRPIDRVAKRVAPVEED